MKKILWCDLETTGLDFVGGKILEVSAIVTDTKFNELESFSHVVGWKDDIVSHMNDYVRNMHTANGLLDEVRFSIKDLYLVDCYFANFIGEHFGSEKPLLTGNTISFDRTFIQQHMPKSSSLLHYRTMDVSGMVEAVSVFGGIEIARPASSKHRGLPDIRDSIELMKNVVSSWNL
jgi:oligoribonuclease